MRNERIKVTAYSGSRGEEKPRELYIREEKIRVVEILDMWIEKGSADSLRKRFFKVLGSDGYVHKIYYDEKLAEWFYA